VVALVLAAAVSGLHLFGLDDWTALRSANALSVSKDGSSILYHVAHGVQKGVSAEEWRTIHFDGSGVVKLNLPTGYRPTGFTANGELFGTYAQGDKDPQAAILAIGSAQPRVITHLPHGVGALAISPDGSRIATLASNRASDPLDKVRIVVENDVSTPYIVNVDGTGGSWWCPAHTNAASMAWSPDGSSLALLSQTPKIGHHEVYSYIDVCSTKTSHHVATITNAASSIGWIGGNTLATLSTRTQVLTPEHVYTMPASGGTAVDRTPNLSGTALDLACDPRGTVWVLVNRGVQLEIDRFANGAISRAYSVPMGVVSGPPVFSPFSASTNRLAFTIADTTHSGNVAVARGLTLARITHEGDDVLSHVALGKVQVAHWQGPQTPLTGIVTFPPGYVSGKKYPFVELPHGGPESSDGLGFDPFSRLLAERGYVVMQPEYRGSTGVNSQFLAAIYQHFGDRAYADVESATDYAIAQGWADPKRLAIFGWSAGGFMTSWTVTQTNRYRAAIEGAGITDWLSFVPTSDLSQIDYDARSHSTNVDAFLKYSAVMYASRVNTPLLILHGQADMRVPTFQGREYFVFLRELGKTARMVVYPGSPHFPRLWEQRRDVFTEIFNWLDRYDPR
jgi:dipeptidyl aminopeptidase/acylaminoacyl peptidase